MSEKLSNESKKFLEDLTLYLISSGKKDTEVTEIVEELQEHLTISESKGKNIEQIVGNSPENYIKQLSAEISTRKSSIIQYLTLATLGVISFSFVNNLIDGIYTFSLVKLGGILAISALFIVLLAIVYKKSCNVEYNAIKRVYALFSCKFNTIIVIYRSDLFR